MKNKKILSKEVGFASEEEFKKIVNFIVSNLKEDSENTVFELDENEEIDAYFGYKKSLTVIRIDIIFDTNDSLTIFECIEISNIKNSNDFIKANYSYKLIDNKLEDISLDDLITLA